MTKSKTRNEVSQEGEEAHLVISDQSMHWSERATQYEQKITTLTKEDCLGRKEI